MFRITRRPLGAAEDQKAEIEWTVGSNTGTGTRTRVLHSTGYSTSVERSKKAPTFAFEFEDWRTNLHLVEDLLPWGREEWKK